MKQIVKYRWAIIALWIVTALSLSLLSPNLQALVVEKGQLTIPDEYPSKQANRLLAEMSSYDVEMHDIVLVFHRDEGLDETDKKDIKTVIDRLNESKDEWKLHLFSIFPKMKESKHRPSLATTRHY